MIRRSHPPPTTVALDEDFDAATIEDASTIYGGAGPPYADREQEDAMREEAYRDDSPENGDLGLRLGQIEVALSDLHIGIGGPTSTNQQSSSEVQEELVNQTRGRKRSDECTRRDSKLSRVRKGVPDDGRDTRQNTGGRADSQKVGMIEECVIDEGPGRTITMWRERVDDTDGLDGTQISYEEFGLVAGKEDREPATRTHSHRDLNQRKSQRQSGSSKYKGEDAQGTNRCSPAKVRKSQIFSR